MLDVVETVERVTGHDVQVEHRPAVAEPRVLMADSSLIRSELGWRPAHSSLEEIVTDAWAAVQEPPSS
jgi:UDP-glucose 4-epimerase